MIPQDRSSLLLDRLHGQLDPWEETDLRERPPLSHLYPVHNEQGRSIGILNWPHFGASDTGSHSEQEIGTPGQSSLPSSSIVSDSSQMDVES